jgi:hypothetical protein
MRAAAVVTGFAILAAGGKLDLHLKSPKSTASIEGTWTYAPLDGGEPYPLEIRATQGGFYQFEGVRVGQSRPVLELDRAEEGAGYRGEVTDGFDPCVGAGARFRLYPAGDSLVFEPALPVSGPFVPTLPGACTSSRHYFLAARGHGDRIRIKPADELAGLPSQANTDARDPQGRADPRRGSRQDAPGATVTIGAPSAPDGTEVELLGSLHDAARKLWHHVRLIGPVSDEPAPENEKPPEKASEKPQKPEKPEKPEKPDKPAGPVTGYVPAESVVVRWDCRLTR